MDNFSELDEKRVQMYQTIHEYHAAGYSKREIAKILRCSRNTVTKNISGDFEALCKKDFRSGIDMYYDYIIKSLQAGMCRKDVYRNIISQGYKGKQTAAYDYMNKIINRFNIEISINKSASADVIQKRKALQKYDHISRAGVFRFLWMNAEIPREHKEYLFKTYPQIKELYACIKEFREIFNDKKMPLLYLFIDRYKKSELKSLSTFANGLEKDIRAIENAVASNLSNGFVEGTNSKLKMTKRVMYGRCSKNLLSAKMMYDVRAS